MCVYYIKQFGYVKIDDKNPRLDNDEWFRDVIKKRKKIHRLFDMIKCNKHWTFFDPL